MMKVYRNSILRWVLLITVLQPLTTYAQGPFKVNSLLNIVLSDSVTAHKEGYVNTYYGGDSLQSYELLYFDTVLVRITDGGFLAIALKSFVAGKFAGEDFRLFDLQLTDTVIGSLPGLFIRGATDDTTQAYRKFYCFMTMANSKSYWFFYYLRDPSMLTTKADHFFSSIQFERNKIKEAAFRISPFKKHKRIGKIWYQSPELDAPWIQEERVEEKPDKSFPPRPPSPPIDRKSLVKAGKLASDYVSNRSLADKKYKKKYGVTVEGIVKEVKEIDEFTLVIVLDGSPSAVDVQCRMISAYKARKLKKGMKATFLANCDGLNGDVILSKCIYIEDPTYE